MDIPKEAAERRVWIIGRLRLRGTSLAAIARDLGVARQSVQGALLVPSERIEKAIADALALPVHDLFPDRYSGEGRRICQSRPWNYSGVSRAGERLKQRSA
ncbi:helix-turn-helix domain-containing protein [Inquilinus sp. OTU3971]|uniref:helix-turn-helix domain-containing protein n=1 Tax=Inquilinus sp. OTU3971 TaxID=3043855 RepID=UPI00406C3BFA